MAPKLPCLDALDMSQDEKYNHDIVQRNMYPDEQKDAGIKDLYC